MAEAVAGVHIDISAETAKLQEGVKKAQSIIRQFGKNAERDGKAVGDAIAGALTRAGGMIAAAFSVQSLTQFTAESLKSAAAIGRFADQAGLTAQQFQGLDHALRGAQVPTEQLAAGFAIFSRNMSDLHRGTGPFLQFLRDAAPHLVGQFRAAKDTSEAFFVLTNAVNRFGNEHDRVRLLNAAGAEQFGKLNNAIRQGVPAIQEQMTAFRGLSNEAISKAQEIERRWEDLWRKVRLAGQQTVLAAIEQFQSLNTANASVLEAEIRRLEGIKASQETLGRNVESVTRQLERQRAALVELRLAADNMAGAPAPDPVDKDRLRDSAIKAAQGALQLYIAQLNQLPSQMNFVSEAYIGAWQRMDAALAASGATAAQRQAARIQLIQQEAQARQQALGTAMMMDEQLALRGQELALRRQQGILTETEYQRALNLARSEYGMAQLQELQGLGVTLSFQEQYLLSIERINNALAVGKVTTEQAGRAHQAAAFAAQAAWAAGLGSIAQNLSQAFGKNKAIATAAAIISTYEAVNKTLATYGATPWGFAAAAAALAAGVANVRAINSTTETSKTPAVGGGAVASAPVEPQQTGPQRSLTISLNGADMFSRQQVQELIERINSEQRQGTVLIATQVRS